MIASVLMRPYLDVDSRVFLVILLWSLWFWVSYGLIKWAFKKEENMKTVSFYGSSDDLIEIGGIKGADEFPADGKPIAGVFLLGGRMIIYAIYGNGACWSFCPAQADEDVPFPAWPIRISQHENGYSTLLEIDVPDDVALFRLDGYRY